MSDGSAPQGAAEKPAAGQNSLYIALPLGPEGSSTLISQQEGKHSF